MNKYLLKAIVLFFGLASNSRAAEPRFDWSSVLLTPKLNPQEDGNQVLHFYSMNKPYWNNEYGSHFVETYLSDAVPLKSDAEVLKYGSDSVKLNGLFIELGVCTGKTINFIAALNPLQRIYGFDSFEGLPEDWVRGDVHHPRGIFAFKDSTNMPPVLNNVELIKGLFNDTLPLFFQNHESSTPIAFLHIDCDIYSSTAAAFNILGDRIRPGTILVFDELYNYPEYKNHEFKAFQEFLTNHNFKARYLAYNINHEQVAVEIMENK